MFLSARVNDVDQEEAEAFRDGEDQYKLGGIRNGVMGGTVTSLFVITVSAKIT